MRGWLSVVALLLVLAGVGLLLKQRMAALRSTRPALVAPPGPAWSPASNPPQSRNAAAQLQQQYRQALEQAIQQPRPLPDDDAK